MTLFDEGNMKCSVCGKKSGHPFLLSSNQFGYQDLDTRPSEMYRSSMHTWLSKCPNCGYVASNLNEDLEINEDFLNSEQYKTCDGIEFKSDVSEMFYKSYLIENERKDDVQAFRSILRCAWACDDTKDEKNSKLSRQLGVERINKIIEKNENVSDDFLVLKSDLLRRMGEFDQLMMNMKILLWKTNIWIK